MRKVAHIDECPSSVRESSGEKILFADDDLKPTSGVDAVQVDGVSEFLLSLNFGRSLTETGGEFEPLVYQ